MGYHFNQCRDLFYADLFKIDGRNEEKLEEKFERENRLRKLKPMKNRMLFFKNGTFKIDTLNRDVVWATEKRHVSSSTTAKKGQQDALPGK